MDMDIEAEVAYLKAEVANLKTWQTSQNGTLVRLDDKVGKLQYWLMGIFAGLAVQLLILLFKI